MRVTRGSWATDIARDRRRANKIKSNNKMVMDPLEHPTARPPQEEEGGKGREGCDILNLKSRGGLKSCRGRVKSF